jgi:hypothetical protein
VQLSALFLQFFLAFTFETKVSRFLRENFESLPEQFCFVKQFKNYLLFPFRHFATDFTGGRDRITFVKKKNQWGKCRHFFNEELSPVFYLLSTKKDHPHPEPEHRRSGLGEDEDSLSVNYMLPQKIRNYKCIEKSLHQ